MTTSNWVELGIFFAVLLIGFVLMKKSKRAVADIEGFGGVMQKSEMKGRVIGGDAELSHQRVKHKIK